MLLRRLLELGLVGTATAVKLTGVVHYITVGMGDHRFKPNLTTADPGDVISFQFYPTNHSVVRMDPTMPCKPYEMVNTSDADGGWWSGFKPVSAFLNPPPSWNITVNNTDPLYFYCSAPQSCINFEMVGAINVDNTTHPLSAVAAAAGSSGFSLSPGESWPSDATIPQPSTSSTPTTPSSSSSSPSSSASSGSVTLSPGAIAGIAIGGVIALALIGLLFFFVGRKKKGAEINATATSTTTPQPPPTTTTAAGYPDVNMGEHPPVYQDPRYSQLPVGAGHWDQKAHDEEQARLAGSQNPNRISELPDSSTYDPVEIYTPGPEDMPAHRR